jgi:esterase/lipase
VKEALVSGARRAAGNLGRIGIPVLMLGGKEDPLVKSGGFERLLNDFGTVDKRLMLYDKARHRIVQNAAKDESIPDIIKWLKER